MGRHVDRKYLIDLVNQYYSDQEKNSNFCCKSLCLFYQRSTNLEKELRDRPLNTRYAKQKKWFIIYHQKNNYKITVFPIK